MSSLAEVEKAQKFFNYLYANLGYSQLSSLFAESTGQAWVDDKWGVFFKSGHNVHKLIGSLDNDKRNTLYLWYRAETDTEN